MYKEALLHLSKGENKRVDDQGEINVPTKETAIIDLCDDLEINKREGTNVHEDMDTDYNDQPPHNNNCNKKQDEQNIKNPNKKDKKVVFDSRRGIQTFAWGDKSDDDTVILQNQADTKAAEWQKVQNKKTIKNQKFGK